MNKKYELLNKDEKTGLYRIRALRDFSDVKKGDLGGLIEKEENLSQHGCAWIYKDACVYNNARVYGDAWVSGNAYVYNNARVCGDACVSGGAYVYGNARVFGNACVFGDARVSGNTCVFGNAYVSSYARVYGNACVYGNLSIIDGHFTKGNFTSNDEIVYFEYSQFLAIFDLNTCNVQIGCENKTAKEWLQVKEHDDFNDAYISAYKAFIRMCILIKRGEI